MKARGETADHVRAGGFAREISLRAGPLEAVLEPSTGFLRCVRIGGQEIPRGVYARIIPGAFGRLKASSKARSRAEALDRFA